MFAKKMKQLPGMLNNNSLQKGIAALWILGLVILGIVAGTYAIQTNTGFSPKAAGKTVACDGQTLSGQSEQSKADFNAIYGDKAVEEWVAEHEKELVAKGIPCNNPGGYAPGIGTGAGKNSGASTGSNGSGNASSETIASDTSAKCSQSEANNALVGYYDAKVANNLARFEAIVKGVSGYCVPADFGLPGSQETANSKDGAIKNGRLMLCSGGSKDGGLPDLLWMVPNSDLSKPIIADKQPAPSRDTIESAFASKVQEARKVAGLSN